MKTKKGFFVLILFVFSSCIFIFCQNQPQNTVKSFDGVCIAYQFKGTGNPALVFVHGWSCDRSAWESQLNHFAQKYRVITIDLAGHGESGLNRKVWTIESFGKDVKTVVEKLKLESIILVGHSLGGQVIVECAHLMPHRILGLVGVDTYQNFEDEPTQQEIENFLIPMRENFQESTYNFARRVLFAPNSDPTLVEKISSDMASVPPEVGIGTLRHAWTYNIREKLKNIRIPIYCINSDFYPVYIESNRKYAHFFKVEFMTGVGHFLMIEDPPTFNRHLSRIIEALKANAKVN